jgi:methylenetetrahydrofolate reductase (NADPH)
LPISEFGAIDMNIAVNAPPTDEQAVKALLRSYSIEVTSKDEKGFKVAAELMRSGSEVFVANLPNETIEQQVEACATLAKAGLNPVPHVVARNTESREQLDRSLARLTAEGGVRTCLVLGGDRDQPKGPFDAAVQMIETGLFEKHGVQRVAFGCHPEGHPRVPDHVIWPALDVKLKAARARGLQTYLVSQFVFAAAPMIALARRLRASGISEPLRLGVAGPANRGALIKYALVCGVGPSLRALRERHDLARQVIAGETPEALLLEVARANAAEPALGLEGVHFFTFGSVEKSVSFAEGMRA